MIDCTLDAMFGANKVRSLKDRDPSSDRLKEVGANTQARIEKAFSRQAKVAARLRQPYPTHR